MFYATDINECQENEDICEHGCSNTIGGYRCKCPRGFQIDDNNKCVGKRIYYLLFYKTLNIVLFIQTNNLPSYFSPTQHTHFFFF